MNTAEETSPTILVVDDLEENTQILESFLRPKGYNTFSASSGRSALEFVAAHPPDVILLDLMMPDLDGYEVCRRLKQDIKTHHIPIIIITGLTEKEANVHALESGADDFLVKPFDAVLLSARIRSSLRSKALQDQVFLYQSQLEEANQTLEQRIRDRTAQVARTQQVAVFSLAKLAESRDTETGTHLERMRSYAREIAVEICHLERWRNTLPPDFAEQVFQSSPLHDIGKVGIPDAIFKPGKLTPQEFEIMKAHTIIGGDTLRAADIEAGQESFLAMGRDIAYHHHERWDGKGYPFGMSGEEIPLAARLVAVSDVYDALSSKRPYKEAFSHEKSREIIFEGRGTQFDPEIVDAFLNREENILAIRARFKDLTTVTHIHRIAQLLAETDSGEKAIPPIAS
jgi:putative two-component system response regulator